MDGYCGDYCYLLFDLSDYSLDQKYPCLGFAERNSYNFGIYSDRRCIQYDDDFVDCQKYTESGCNRYSRGATA